jgi:hypothetical protein
MQIAEVLFPRGHVCKDIYGTADMTKHVCRIRINCLEYLTWND